MLESGFVAGFASRRHIPVPGEEAIPALIATAIVQVSVADIDALAKAFAVPGLHEVIGRWQSRYPYKVAWANHEPLDRATAAGRGTESMAAPRTAVVIGPPSSRR